MMKIDTKESSKRYFYVQYSISGGIGAVAIHIDGMLNRKRFVEYLKQVIQEPVYNLFILSWVEMSKEDFEAFVVEDDNE